MTRLEKIRASGWLLLGGPIGLSVVAVAVIDFGFDHSIVHSWFGIGFWSFVDGLIAAIPVIGTTFEDALAQGFPGQYVQVAALRTLIPVVFSFQVAIFIYMAQKRFGAFLLFHLARGQSSRPARYFFASEMMYGYASMWFFAGIAIAGCLVFGTDVRLVSYTISILLPWSVFAFSCIAVYHVYGVKRRLERIKSYRRA